MSDTLKKFSQGFIVGMGASLPGISGGVLLTVFGIYNVIIDFLANPFQDLKKRLSILIPVFAGIVLGFIFISGVLTFFLNRYYVFSLMFFCGLVFGMVPDLCKKVHLFINRRAFLSFVTAVILMFILLNMLNLSDFDITPNSFWYFFCGVSLALSVIVPGLSFSTILMPLNLYEPLIESISQFNLKALIPCFFGAVFSFILLSKLVKKLFDRFSIEAGHAVLGIILCATVIIMPFDSVCLNITTFVLNSVILIAGGLISYYFPI